MDIDLGRLVDALPGIVWAGSADGGVDFVNRQWCEYAGLASADGCGVGWQDSVHSEDLPGLLRQVQQMLSAGASVEVEIRLRRFDGVYRWFRCSATTLTAPPAHPRSWCCLCTDIEADKRAEEVWRANDFRLRAIVDDTPAMLTLMTPEGKLAYGNRYMLDFFARPLEQIRRKEVFHPEDSPKVEARWLKSLQTGCPYDFEARLLRADGVYRWFHTRGLPVRDAEGRIVVWHLLQIDIDERKQAESLMAYEKRVRKMIAADDPLPAILMTVCNVMESMTACRCSIVLLDSMGHLRSAGASSPPGSSVADDGGPGALAVRRNEPVIVADIGADSSWCASWRDSILAQGFGACWSTPIPSKSGGALGALVLEAWQPGSPTPQHQAVVAQFTQIASIAIERARSHEALRRGETLLAEAQRLSSSGSFYWRPDTDELRLSDEYHRIFGFAAATPVSIERLCSRIHTDDAPEFVALLERGRNQGGDLAFSGRLLMDDRSIKYVDMVAHRSNELEARPLYVGAVQDVTSRRRSEETLSKVRSELARVARVTSLGAVTASIAHEVNQPLSGIVTNASTCLRMLAADPPNLDGARETARRTIRDGHRASEVITRLRELFVRKDTAAESVDINEATREVIALSRTELDRGGVHLHTALALHLPAVAGDRVQLQQVILNLILNAIEAMSGVEDRPRQLWIRTDLDDVDGIRLSVQDTGVGLEAHGEEKIFDAFYTSKSGGMGIGLSVSRSIIESHRGRLWAAHNDGPGATFSFSIPHDGAAASLHRSSGADPVSPQQPPRYS